MLCWEPSEGHGDFIVFVPWWQTLKAHGKWIKKAWIPPKKLPICQKDSFPFKDSKLTSSFFKYRIEEKNGGSPPLFYDRNPLGLGQWIPSIPSAKAWCALPFFDPCLWVSGLSRQATRWTWIPSFLVTDWMTWSSWEKKTPFKHPKVSENSWVIVTCPMRERPPSA